MKYYFWLQDFESPFRYIVSLPFMHHFGTHAHVKLKFWSSLSFLAVQFVLPFKVLSLHPLVFFAPICFIFELSPERRL